MTRRLATTCLLALAVFLGARAANAEDSGYIHEWLVLGAFPHEWDAERLSFDPIHEEAAQNPAEGRFGGGEKWRRVATGDVLDFRGADCGFAVHEHAIAYAHVYVKAASERHVTLAVGSDDGVGVWVNGERVLWADVTRGLRRDESSAPVTLRAGWNRVLFKVSQGIGDWQLCARFLDSGKPANGLEVHAANPDPADAYPEPEGAPHIDMRAVRIGAHGVELRLLNTGGPVRSFEVELGVEPAIWFAAAKGERLAPGEATWRAVAVPLETVARLGGFVVRMRSNGAQGQDSEDTSRGGLGDLDVLRVGANVAELPELARAVAELEGVASLFPERLSASEGSKPLLAALATGKKETLAAAAAKALETFAPFEKEARESTVFLLGNAHIDMAWLWRWEETVRVCHDTYAQALAFMDEFEGFRYTQSSAQTYAWIEEKYPSLFEKIRQRAKEGRWEVVGGTWVESDNNMPSGEAYARQLLYGKRWFLEKLGQDVTVGWMPDSFGFAWTLPQLYRKAGIDTFLTTKLDWSDTTRWNERTFWWEGPDGSRLLVVVPRDGYDKAHLSASKIATVAREERRRADLTAIPYMYGVGDHGGGPTREAIGEGQALAKRPLYPVVRFATAREMFDQTKRSEPATGYPVVRDELYLELHRGVATSQEPQKRQNRRAERLLVEAERFSAAASLVAARPYPAEPLAAAWKKALFNQFHDILPGSAIRAVYEDSARDYGEVFATGERALDEARAAILARANVPAAPEGGATVVVWNALPWERTGVVRVASPVRGTRLAARTAGGVESGPVQVLAASEGKTELCFVARGVPACGYAVFVLEPREAEVASAVEPAVVSEKPEAIALENGKLRVVIDRATGELVSAVDLATGREAIAPGERANVLEALDDRPVQWDAWEVTKAILDGKPLGGWDKAKVSVIASGPVRAVVRVERCFRRSTIVQDLVLDAGSSQVDFRTEADWHDHHVLLKAAFPLAARDRVLSCAIPFGTIDRPTTPSTPAEEAKHEVNAHEWVDLSEHAAEPGPEATLVDLSTAFEGRASADLNEQNRLDLEPGQKRLDAAFDATRYSYPREALPNRATALGVEFALGRAARGSKDYLACHGQRIAVPAGDYDEIIVAGASTEGDEGGVLTVEGPSGEKLARRLWLTDWCGRPVRRDAVLVACDRRRDAGAQDDLYAKPRIWASPVALGARTKVSALVLPDRPRMKILAIALVRRPAIVRRPLFGASILSDTKYGFDAKGSRVRVSLLRSPTDPDPKADEGSHRFVYSLLPHEGGWREALSVRRGEELASPLAGFVAAPHAGAASAEATIAVEPVSVELAAWKRAEDGKGWVLRLVERHGARARARVRLPVAFASAADIDIVERPVASPNAATLADGGKTLEVELAPWEIRTLRVRAGD